MTSDAPRFTIIGAGLAGALLANYLAKVGVRVDVYERRRDPRRSGFTRGRSINLAISERGINALRGVGLADSILAQAIPMRGRMIHAPDGATTFQPYDKDPARCIRSISRADLNLALVEAAERNDNVRFHFDATCVEVDLDRAAARCAAAGAAKNSDESPERAESWTDGSVLIGADGAYSAVRAAMQRQQRFDYSQSYLAHGYKELAIPADAGGAFQMEKNALHIWPRRKLMMIALPNRDGSFTCTLFWPFDGAAGFGSIRTDSEVRQFFDQNFPDALPLMPALVEDYAKNPVGTLVTVRCAPWHYRDRAVLVGDAAHAIVPFYGQGMNAAFEDCVELDRCIHKHAMNLEHAFEEFSRVRKPNVDAIADLALSNFVEMRDHTGKRRFRARKAAERGLHRLLGFWYAPLYTLISFTNVPYAEAVRRTRRQERIVIAAAITALIAIIIWAVFRFTGGP